MRDLIRLFRLYVPYWRWITAGIALGVITVLANFGLLALAGWFLTAAAAAGLGGIAAQNSFNFFTPAAFVRLFATLRVLGRYAARIVDHEATFRQIARVRVFLFAHLVPLAPLGLGRDRSGDVLARLVTDVERLSDFYPRVLAPAAVAAIAAVAMALVIAAVAPIAGFALFGALLATGIALPLFSLRAGAAPGKAIVAQEALLRAELVDMVQGMPDLLTHGAERPVMTRLAAADTALVGAQRRARAIAGASTALSGFLGNAALAMMLVIAVPLLRAGRISGAEVAFLVFGTWAAFEAVALLGQAFHLLGQIRAAARRVFETVDRTPDVTEPAMSPPRPRGLDLTLRGLRLRYRPEGPWVLDGLDLTIREGERWVLIGRSGAGKTTLTQLLLRFVEYQQGSARLGGVELRAIRGDDVRSLFTVIAQRTFLFHGTLRENLLLAQPAASEAALWRALDIARLADFVRAQPEGLETLVGEGGARLSGGEARRVAIARAVLRDTPWLILDEPMEGLDPLTEALVQTALETVTAGRTVLTITHRLAAVRDSDHVAVIAAGRIVESGTFGTLRHHGIEVPRLLALQSAVTRL